MKKRFFKNHKRILTDHKQPLCDECPCATCGDFDKYPTIYVDKHATGTGNGSSWENAYTNIQTAVNAHPMAKIQIKGYGESDCYPAGITLLDCVYLHGVDAGSGAVWLDGESTTANGINGVYHTTSRIDYINIKNCTRGFFWCLTLNYCATSNCGGCGYYQCKNLFTCEASGGGDGFSYCTNAYYCTAENTYNGFYGLLYGVGCIVNNTTKGHGFIVYSDNTLIDCDSNYSGNFGFSCGGGTLINCNASNSQRCGFRGATTYINCTDSNNCLEWGGDCTGQISPDCDEV